MLTQKLMHPSVDGTGSYYGRSYLFFATSDCSHGTQIVYSIFSLSSKQTRSVFSSFTFVHKTSSMHQGEASGQSILAPVSAAPEGVHQVPYVSFPKQSNRQVCQSSIHSAMSTNQYAMLP